MACCLYFFQGSRTWLALLVPIFAVFASFSIALSALLILCSTMFFLIFSNQKPNMVQENPIFSSTDSSSDDFTSVPRIKQETVVKKAVKKDDKQEVVVASQDLYSESESMDHFSSTSSEDHSSDVEWPYSMGQRLDCSDDSITDEESLIEIAIPSGQFVSRLSENCYSKCCRLSDFSHQESMLYQKEFWADINEMNEEDNLIEIDIYMGSIK